MPRSLPAGARDAAVAHGGREPGGAAVRPEALRRSRAHAREAAATGTRDYRTWRNLGAARYWAPGERAKAAEAYRRAAALAEEERRVDPKNARLLAHLADCYAMLGEKRQGAEFGRARRWHSRPDDRRVAALVAGVYEQLGDREAALRWLASRSGTATRSRYRDRPDVRGASPDPRWAKLAAVRPRRPTLKRREP